jgi:hypothetical protein
VLLAGVPQGLRLVLVVLSPLSCLSLLFLHTWLDDTRIASCDEHCWPILLAHIVGSYCWLILLAHIVGSYCWLILLAHIVGSYCWLILLAHIQATAPSTASCFHQPIGLDLEGAGRCAQACAARGLNLRPCCMCLFHIAALCTCMDVLPQPCCTDPKGGVTFRGNLHVRPRKSLGGYIRLKSFAAGCSP